jgi:hypothetical protein
MRRVARGLLRAKKMILTTGEIKINLNKVELAGKRS